MLAYLLPMHQPSTTNAMMFANAHGIATATTALVAPLPPLTLLELDVDDAVLACLVEATATATNT